MAEDTDCLFIPEELPLPLALELDPDSREEDRMFLKDETEARGGIGDLLVIPPIAVVAVDLGRDFEAE